MTKEHGCVQDRRLGVVEKKVEKLEEKQGNLYTTQEVFMEKMENLIKGQDRLEKAFLSFVDEIKRGYVLKEEIKVIDDKINDFRDQYRKTLWYIIPLVIGSLASAVYSLAKQLFLQGK